ncbi:hypothetical protein [Xenorhabdus hominickii]|uniref:Uncharacterized protein n=1 Tax=Xenorhabdus hominickii TaxID=351679 RepID=A0A2G0QDW6_XENHO|nr:hypothetical protein [Xenorhabdus hominickii]PHM57425.1 hypothetical protein Xhom_00392 [Xenorhabdus hominickii]
MGIAFSSDIEEISVNSLMVDVDLPDGDRKIRLNTDNNVIRASLGYCDNYNSKRPEYDSGCMVQITDNFGCISKLLIMGNRDFTKLYIVDE